jgi:DNA-binding CsgD family transcriptional regulator
VEELLALGGELGTESSAPARASLSVLVGERLDTLPDEARTIADALGVLGRPADTRVVAAVAGLDPLDADVALAAAERASVVVRGPRGWGFRHPLFGEAVAANLAGTARAAALHRRAAEHLAADAQPAELVRHWEAADDTERTWSTSLAAAAQAEAGAAFVEMRSHLERAARLWPRGRTGRGDALLRAAYAAWMAGDPDGAVDLARDASEAGARGPEARVATAQFLWDAGHRSEATELFESAAGAIEAGAPPRVRAVALWGLGRARIGQGAHDEAYRMAKRAAQIAAASGDATWLSHAWVLAGMSRAWMNDIGGIAELERGLAAAIESGHPEAVGHAYQFLVELLWVAGRLHDAQRVGLDGIAACDRLGLARSHGADVRGRTALALIDLGEWRAADNALEGAEPRAHVAVARALLAVRRGEWEAAERDLGESETQLSIGGRGRLGGLTEVARAELAWLRGDTDGVDAALAAIAPQPGIWETDIAARRSLWRARSHLSSDRCVIHFDPALADTVNEELRAAASGAADSWRAAASGWERLERPYEQAVALFCAAEASYRSGDGRASSRSVDSAMEIAERVGAAALVDRAGALAPRSRAAARRNRSPRADPLRLTPRELEVLALLGEGRTNPEIAQHLFLSVKTVGIHVSHVLEKLGAHTRGAAVAEARRRQLLG